MSHDINGVASNDNAGAVAPATPSPLDALLAASDAAVVPTEVMPVPELGGAEVEFWGLSAAERAEMWTTCYRKVPAKSGVEGEEESEPIYEKLYPFLLTRCMRLPGTGTLIYQGDRAKPEYINSRAPALLDRCVSVVFRLSGLGKESLEAEKNGSGRTESSGTSSGSPASSDAPSQS